MAERIVTLGEIMLRLTPPGHERLLQSPRLEATFGGAEANVAVSLSRFGLEAAFVTVLPRNPLAEAAVRHLRAHGVDVSLIRRGEGRMGLYYLERGAGGRPGKVIYDRTGSAISIADPGAMDWEQVFKGASWFHLTGITPAISQAAADLCLAGAQAAKARGLTVSCDYNYRSKLWGYGRSAPEVMTEIMQSVDIGIGSVHSCRMSLGIGADQSDDGEGEQAQARALTRHVLSRFPQLRLQAIPWRETLAGNRTRLAACLFSGDRFFVSASYEVSPVVDGVGAGDAFAAGLIYSLATAAPLDQALEFATGAACLKHSIPGDWNLVDVSEVDRLISREGTDWIER